LSRRKWQEVFERLPVERKDKSLMEISGFEGFCTDMVSLRRKILNYFCEQFKAERTSDVCEVGCGCGDKLLFFYQQGHVCHGVDYSANMIKRAKEEIPRADLHVSEAAILPFTDNSMDFIFSYGVFQYFESWDYCQRVLSEMYRIAKPDAVICICDIPDIREKARVAAYRKDREPGYEHCITI